MSDDRSDVLIHTLKEALTTLQNVVAEEAAECRRNSIVAAMSRSMIKEIEKTLKEVEPE